MKKKLLFFFIFINIHAIELNKLCNFSIGKGSSAVSNWLIEENKAFFSQAKELENKFELSLYCFNSIFQQIEKIDNSELIIDYSPQILTWFKHKEEYYLIVLGINKENQQEIYTYKLKDFKKLIFISKQYENKKVLPYIKQVKINSNDYLILSSENKIYLYLFSIDTKNGNIILKESYNIVSYDGEIISFDVITNNKGKFIGFSGIRTDGISEICVHQFEYNNEILNDDLSLSTIASLIDDTQGCVLKWIFCDGDYYLILISNKEYKKQEIKIYYYDFYLGALFLVDSTTINERGCANAFELFCSAGNSYIAWSSLNRDLNLSNLKIFEFDFSENSNIKLTSEKIIGDNLIFINSFNIKDVNYLALIKESNNDKKVIIYHIQKFKFKDIFSNKFVLAGVGLLFLYFLLNK